MENQSFWSRRQALFATLFVTLGSTVSLSVLRRPALAQSRLALDLRAAPKMSRLKAGLPESPISALENEGTSAVLRFKQGDDLQVSLLNELSALSVLNWRGFDGLQTAEPLMVQKPLASGSRTIFSLPLRRSGTFLIDVRLLGDGEKAKDRPFPVRAFVVEEIGPSGVDRDETLLIEDWRVKPDGVALAAGTDPAGAETVYTLNGAPDIEIRLKPYERLRLRVINGCQRAPVGLRIENHEPRIMAIDSAPAEPFPARDGQLVLAPGSRIDALIDATTAPGTTSNIVLHDGTTPRTIGRLVVTSDAPARSKPLPPAPAFSSAHLPAQLDLKNATRVELQLDAKMPWSKPSEFTSGAPSVVQVKQGRVVVMAITNPTATPVVFRFHGHHFRLLDRLDDGWKPFWLDTLLLDARQTQRIAFLAEYAGRWLIESAGIGWSAPQLVRFYSVA